MSQKLKAGLIFPVLFFYAYVSFSQNKDTLAPDSVYKMFVNNAFQPGELLRYRVRYGLINGGEANLTVGLRKVGYDWFYHAVAEAKTTGVTEALAKIKDRYESFFEPVNCMPVKAIRNIHENNYRRYGETLFDRKRNVAMNLKTGNHSVPSGILDIISAFYHARKHIFKKELKADEIIVLTTFFDDEIFDVKIRFKEKMPYDTDFGTINCLRFAPVLEEGSPFEKEENLEIYVSDDGNYIPVFIKLKLPVGSIKCELAAFKNLVHPFGKDFIRTSKEKKRHRK